VLRIAFIHNKLRGTDGVSLEVDKWRYVAESMGHEVFYIAGNEYPDVITVPLLSFDHPTIDVLLRNATAKLKEYKGRTSDLIKDVHPPALELENNLMDVIRRNHIDLLVPNNLLSMGFNVPAVPSLAGIIKKTKIPTIGHWHDFWFEGEKSGEVNVTCDEIRELYMKFAPPDLTNLRQVVINSVAQKALYDQRGIHSHIVPNVFDFSQRWKIDEYNADFRKELGIGENDIVLLQATRVLDRKAIELAIETTAEVIKEENIKHLYENKLYDGRQFTKDDNIILLCAGLVESRGISSSYVEQLIRYAKEKGVDLRFVEDRVEHSRTHTNGKKIYSLWDSYVHADFVTYLSVWEGFGNQFLEAVNAELPVVLFEYLVYEKDIGPLGFDVVSIGNEYEGKVGEGFVTVPDKKIQEASRKVVTLLINDDKRRGVTTENLNIAKANFGYDRLEKEISKLFNSFKMA